MAQERGILNDNLFTFLKSTECPDLFMDPQDDKREIFKSISKNLYDIVQSKEREENIPSKGLPKLIIKNFDDEQIWQQIDLQNNIISYYSRHINKLESENITLGVDVDYQTEENISNHPRESDGDGESDFSGSSKEEYAFDDSDSDDIEASEIMEKNACTELNKSQNLHTKAKPSEVDDQFFKLSELEEFLKIEDLKYEKGLQEPSDGSDDLEYFEDIPSDADFLEAEETGKKKSARDLMYNDFFGQPDNQMETGDQYIEQPSSGKEDGSLCNESDGGEYIENNLKDNANESDIEPGNLLLENDNLTSQENNFKPVVKTAFENQQEKEKRKMRELEESLMKDKPWQLTGEVFASSRPKDSLVHQETEFDCNAKQDLVVTDEFENHLEKIIKMAIKNKAWSDVERKIKPVNDTASYKAPVELDQSKSKKSLAELYEDDYLKLQQKEEAEDPKRVEIKKMMDALVPQLSALFCHMPKPPVPEIKVVTNLPAITIEEVAPVSVSDATLLAPEEIMARQRGIPIGKSERTDTDKKRERRKKKKFQKFRSLQEEEEKRKNAANSEYASKKFEKSEAMKKIKQNKNTVVVDGKKGTKVKSSSDFFSRLQDTVSAKISSARDDKKNVK